MKAFLLAMVMVLPAVAQASDLSAMARADRLEMRATAEIRKGTQLRAEGRYAAGERLERQGAHMERRALHLRQRAMAQAR